MEVPTLKHTDLIKCISLQDHNLGEKERNKLLIYKALYDIRPSGARWREKISDDLRDTGLFPCKAKTDICIRKAEVVWKYIVYVNDLTFFLRGIKSLITTLEEEYTYKLKIHAVYILT